MPPFTASCGPLAFAVCVLGNVVSTRPVTYYSVITCVVTDCPVGRRVYATQQVDRPDDDEYRQLNKPNHKIYREEERVLFSPPPVRHVS